MMFIGPKHPKSILFDIENKITAQDVPECAFSKNVSSCRSGLPDPSKNTIFLSQVEPTCKRTSTFESVSGCIMSR